MSTKAQHRSLKDQLEPLIKRSGLHWLVDNRYKKKNCRLDEVQSQVKNVNPNPSKIRKGQQINMPDLGHKDIWRSVSY